MCDVPDARAKKLADRRVIRRRFAREYDIRLLDWTAFEVSERPATALAKQGGTRSFGKIDRKARQCQRCKDPPVRIESGPTEEVSALDENTAWFRGMGLVKPDRQPLEVGLRHTASTSPAAIQHGRPIKSSVAVDKFDEAWTCKR